MGICGSAGVRLSLALVCSDDGAGDASASKANRDSEKGDDVVRDGVTNAAKINASLSMDLRD